MKTLAPSAYQFGHRRTTTGGSALITALIFSIIIGITLASYIKLSTNSLRLSHRTFFADSVSNLAEMGTEEAVWSFNTLGSNTDATSVAAAWSGWTLGRTVSDTYVTSMGSGFTSAPTVTFSGGGGTTQATGTANLSTSVIRVNYVDVVITGVANITLTSYGAGYTSAPAVTLSGGGGSGAAVQARLSATRTYPINNLDQGASGTVQVWADGYDGSATIPMVVTKATITPIEGAPIVKYLKIILSKNGLLPKGLIAKNAISWNGHPTANSYLSSTVPGVPPFTAYNSATARANITLGALYGPTINLGSGGVVQGNVMLGPGVTVTGSGTVSGSTIGNLSYNFAMPTYPTNTGNTGYYNLASTIPATLPRAADLASPAADGKFYYFVSSATIGALTITAGKNVVLVGTSTSMGGGLVIDPTANGTPCGSLKIYMDGPMSPGNSAVNPNTWPGALEVYTSTTSTCTISGNGSFNGCLFAPNAELRGNGGGNNSQDLCGSFVVGSVTSNGHMCFHYDEGLGGTPPAKAWTLALWTELQSEADRAMYASRFNF